MIQRVRVDDIFRADERGDDADVHHVAGREKQRGVALFEAREFAFERFVNGMIP